MIEPLIPSIFLLGMLFQSFFLLRGKIVLDTKKNRFYETDWIGSIVLLIVSLLTFFLSLEEGLGFAIVAFCYIYMILFPIMFQSKILTVVNERKILQLNILVAFLCFMFIYTFIDLILLSLVNATVLTILLMIFIAAPTIGTLIISFTRVNLSRFWRIAFYLWFLAMNVILIIYLTLSMGWFSSVLQGGSISPWSALTLGMISLVLASNLLSIMTAFGESSAESRELFHQKYSDKQLNPFMGLIIIFSYSIPLVLNYFMKIIPNYALINILLLLIFFYDYFDKEVLLSNTVGSG